MIFPSGRVPERAPDWFFVATEACSGGTPDLGFFLGVSGFIGIFGVGFTSGGPRGSHKPGAHPRGGVPPRLVVASGLFSSIFLLQYFLYFPKIFFVNFQLIWTLFDIPFL
jgi:hypothetical protein